MMSDCKSHNELEKCKRRLEELIAECSFELGELNKLLKEKNIQQKQAEAIDKKQNKLRIGEKVLFKLHNSTIFIEVEMIKFISARNQYTLVVLEDNRQVIIRRSLTQWESLLPEEIFLRIHKSTIINTKYIRNIENSNTKHSIILANSMMKLEISQRYFRKLNSRYNINFRNRNF